MLPKVIFLFVIGFILLDAVSCQDALVKSYPGKKKIRDNSCYSSCTECFAFFSTFGRPPLFYDDDGFGPIEDGEIEVNTRNHYEPLVENFIGEMSCLGFCTCYFLNDINALPDSFYGSRVTNPVETCFDSYVQFMERVIYFDYPQFYGIFYNYIFNGFDAMEYYYSDLISEASQEFRERCISDCTDVNVHHQAYTCEDIHIQVDGNPIIAEDSLTVQLDIRHECYRHLNAILYSPSGEKLNLFNFATGNVEVDTCGKDRDLSFELGNTENDDCQTWGSYYFTADTSEDNPELGWGSYTDGSRFGPSVPSYFGESLNDFAQESVEGTWSLCIGDLFNDSGMILEQVLEQMCCNEFFYEFGYYEQRSSYDNYYQLLQLNNDNDFHWAIGEAGDAYSEPIVVDSNDITAFTDEMIFEVGVSFTKNSGDVTVELVLNNDSFEDYPILEFVLSTENGDQRNGPIFAEAFSFFDENTELFADFAGEYSLKVTHGVTDFGEIYEWTLDIAYISRLPQVCGDIFQDYEFGFLCFDFVGDDEYFPYEEFQFEGFPNENNFKRDLPGSKSSANTHAIREIFSSMDEERRNRAINEIQQFTTRTAGISGDTFIGDGNSQFQGDFSWSLHWVPNDEETTLVEEDIIVVAGLTTPPRFVEEITLRYVDTYLNNFIGFTDNNNEGLPPRYYNGYYASHYSDDNNNDDDFSTFTAIIEIDETFDIEQVAVAVDFYHYRDLGSLFISLTSPEGTTVQIYNGNIYDFRCDNNGYLETIFSDFGTSAYNLYNSDDDTACNNNIIRSFQSLSAFVGEDPDGDWILTVTENDDDVGSYVFDWDLLFNWEPTIYTDYDDDDFSVDFYYNNMEFYGHVKNSFGRAIMEEFLFSRINFASNYPNFGGWANSNYVSLRNTMETGYSDFEDTISTQTPGDIFAKKIVTVDFYPLFFQDFFNLSQLENHLQTEMADEFPGESWDSVFTDYNYGYIYTDDDDTTDLDRNPLGYNEVYYSEDYYKYYVYFSPNQQNFKISGVNIENEQNKESYEEYSDFIGFKKYADSIELFFLSTYDLLYTDVYPVQMQYTFQPFLGNLDEITSRTEYRFLQVQSFFYFMEDHYQRDQKSIYYQKNAFLPSPTQEELQLVPRPNYGDDDYYDGFYYYCKYYGGIFYDSYCYNVDEDEDRYRGDYYGLEFLGERTSWDRFFPDPFFPFSPSGYDPSERFADYLFDDDVTEFFLRNLIEDSVLTTIPTGNLIGSSFNIGFDGNWPIKDFASRNSDDYPHGPLLFSPDEAFYPLFDADSAFLFSEVIAVTRKDNFESYNYYFPFFTPDSSFISTFAYQERSYYNGETLTGKLIVQNDGSIPSDFSDNQNYFKKYFNNFFNQFHERFEEPSTTSKFPPSLNRQGSHMLNLVEWLLESCEENIFTGGEDFDLDPLCVRSSNSKASIPINDIFSTKSQCQLSVQNCFSQLCDINDLNEDGSCSSSEFRILNNVCQTNFRNVVFSVQDPNKFKPRNSERTLVQTITVEAGGLCFNDGRKSSCDNFQNILPINLERTFVIYSENDVPEDECYQPCGPRCNMQLVE